MAACIVNCVVHARLNEFICEADTEEAKKKQKGKNKKKGEEKIDKEWFAGDGSCVKKRPSAQEATTEKSKAAIATVEKGKDTKDGKLGQDRKPTSKDGKQHKVEKDKDANKDAKNKTAALPLPIDCKKLKTKRGSGEEGNDEQGPGGKGKNKNEDPKQSKKIKVFDVVWKDPKGAKDTTQENINKFFGVDVMALLTASA